MVNVDFEFNWKYKDFEIRSQRRYNNNPYIELVKWTNDNKDKPHCFTLAYYSWNDEGGELIFIGNRPFEYIAEIDLSPIWKQLWYACGMLQDAYFQARQEV